MMRGKRSVTLDLKSEDRQGSRACVGGEGRRAHRRHAARRHGAPRPRPRRGCSKRNPKLVYGRMTGWGQDGPLAPRAGHDINYIALAGVLHAFGRKGEAPVPPLNLVGDFGGGGMLLGFGVACALLEAARSGQGPGGRRGDGRRRLAARGDVRRLPRRRATGAKSAARTSSTPARPGTTSTRRRTASTSRSARSRRGSTRNCCRSWACRTCGQHDRARWPRDAALFAKTFKSKTRDEWCKVFEGSDACFAPVLSWSEARRDPHNTSQEKLHRGERRRAARAGAALLAHAGRGAARAARARRGRPRRRCASGVLMQNRNRQA